MAFTDEEIMKECLRLAKLASRRGEIPVGCVITCGDEIVARSSNRKESRLDPTAHAEIVAIKSASKKLNKKNLSGCKLFVTLEPCVMCAGAIVNARIDEVVFGAHDNRFGCCGSVMNLADNELFNHRAKVRGGVLEQDCSSVLTEFFVQLRKEKGNHGDKNNKKK